MLFRSKWGFKIVKKSFPKNHHKRVVRFKPNLNKPVEFVAVTICYPCYVGICFMGLSQVRRAWRFSKSSLIWTKQQNHLNCRSMYHTKRVDQQRSDLLINRWGIISARMEKSPTLKPPTRGHMGILLWPAKIKLGKFFGMDLTWITMETTFEYIYIYVY